MSTSSASSFPTEARRIFKRLTVDIHYNMVTEQRVLVEWAMEKSFIAQCPGPYKFTLLRGFSPTDDNFTPLAYTIDQPWLYDNDPVLPQKGVDVFYKVILEDAGGNQYTSQAVHASTYWSRYDWTLAREIIRKETMVMRKRAGVCGWLLKARVFGALCPCTDPDTGQKMSPDCVECYGTGIVGGYYPPFEYWVIMNPTQRLKKLDADQGLITRNIETVRALAYPSPLSNDIWVNANTDQRYVVGSDIVAAARHRGIDLILNLRLEERPRSDPIYAFPIPCSIGDGESVTQVDCCGVVDE